MGALSGTSDREKKPLTFKSLTYTKEGEMHPGSTQSSQGLRSFIWSGMTVSSGVANVCSISPSQFADCITHLKMIPVDAFYGQC